MTEERSDQKLKMKQQEFENSFKQKIKVLVPLVVGCVWDDDKDKLSSSRLAELQKYEVSSSMAFQNKVNSSGFFAQVKVCLHRIRYDFSYVK